MPLLLRIINEKCPQMTRRRRRAAAAEERVGVGRRGGRRGKGWRCVKKGRKDGSQGAEERRSGGGGGCRGGGWMWHQRSKSDCSCLGSRIKAPESVNPNELQRSSRPGTLSPVTVLFQPIDLFSQ